MFQIILIIINTLVHLFHDIQGFHFVRLTELRQILEAERLLDWNREAIGDNAKNLRCPWLISGRYFIQYKYLQTKLQLCYYSYAMPWL